MPSSKDLAADILRFLGSHAGRNPNYDPGFDEASAQYTSPDASMLHAAAERLMAGHEPDTVASSWESGGYRPYIDAAARQWHDRLVAAVNQGHYVHGPKS